MIRLDKVLLILLITLQGVCAEDTIKELTLDNFSPTVESNNVVIVKFSALWCSACEEMKPNYIAVSKDVKVKALFTEVDIDKEEELSGKYEVENIPTTLLFKNGKEVDRYVGILDQEEIALFVDAGAVIDRYKDECSHNSGAFCEKLALVYDDGIAIQVDKSLARDYYEKACELGQVQSCFNVAYMYDIAEGIEENNAKALKLYRKACEAEHRIACHNLAIMYEDGEGVTADANLSIELYKKACKLKYADACYNVALIYEDGKVVKKDLNRAKEFYKLSCDIGDKEACKAWKSLKDK